MHQEASSFYLKIGGATSGTSHAKNSMKDTLAESINTRPYEHSFFFSAIFFFFLPNMQYIQGSVLALSGRRECSIGWPPLTCQQLSLGFLVSLSSQPLKGCHLHFTGEETDASRLSRLLEITPTKWQKQQLNSLLLTPIPMQVSAGKNKDITYPPEMDPWAREKGQR